MDGLYSALARHFYSLQNELRNLRNQEIALRAHIEEIDSELIQLNDILCKHGNHIYEHFEQEGVTK